MSLYGVDSINDKHTINSYPIEIKIKNSVEPDGAATDPTPSELQQIESQFAAVIQESTDNKNAAGQYAANANTSAQASALSATEALASAQSAKTSETNANMFATDAETSATNANTSAQSAQQSASSASESAVNANSSAQSATQSAISANESRQSANQSAIDSEVSYQAAKQSATNANVSAQSASLSENNAENSELSSKSWAVGDTDTRPNENTDNSKYYSVESQKVLDEMERKAQSGELDGFSPVATVRQTSDGAIISITDKTETTSATITNGKNFVILGYFDTLALLKVAIPNPNVGDAYGVGTSSPFDIYVYDGILRDWKNNGTLKGQDGISSYLFIRYGETSTPSQLLTEPNIYIGLCNSTNPIAPTVYTEYTWYKWKGETGRGITSIIQTSGDGSAGATDTYTITYSDNTTSTFSVYNGANGIDGVGIVSILRTSGDGSAGTTDIYTITYTNGNTNTFSVYNGKNGSDATVIVDSSLSSTSTNPVQNKVINTALLEKLDKSGGTMTGSLIAVSSDVSTLEVRNISAGISDISTGTSLSTGAIYLVYE